MGTMKIEIELDINKDEDFAGRSYIDTVILSLKINDHEQGICSGLSDLFEDACYKLVKKQIERDKEDLVIQGC